MFLTTTTKSASRQRRVDNRKTRMPASVQQPVYTNMQIGKQREYDASLNIKLNKLRMQGAVSVSSSHSKN